MKTKTIASRKVVELRVRKALTESSTFKKDWKEHRYPEDQTFTERVNEYTKTFMSYYYPIIRKNKRIYGTVHTVTKSGMSRCASFFVANNSEITNITRAISFIISTPTNDHGELRISGGGMDMLFHVVYRLSYRLFKDEYVIDKVNM